MLSFAVESGPAATSVAATARVPLRASWIEIDSAAIRHNLRLVRRLAGAARVYAVCKGGAYGIGAGLVARFAAEEGIDALACGDPDDARDIRAAGIDLPILLYGTTQGDDLAALAPLDVMVTVHDAATLATALEHDLAFQVELDAGLHRLGFCEDNLDLLLGAAREHPRARIRGVYTHLTDLDIVAAVSTQAMRFDAMAARLAAAGWRCERMVASSRVLVRWPSLSFEAVNPGRLVYGLLEQPWDREVDCRPVLSAVKARVIALQDVALGSTSDPVGARVPSRRRVAVIPLGFSDGYPRLPAGGTALVRGQRVPIIGLRHSEHSMLDVTAVSDAALGDEVVLLGAQGSERIDMHELAAATGVPSIELIPRLAAIPRRVLS